VQSFVPDHAGYGDYCDKVAYAVNLIRAGHLRKVILARTVRGEHQLDLMGTYEMAGRVNRASRSYCFRIDDVAGVGFSPEILLQAEDGVVTTNPLAGTRPRGG
jgi:anthranilate/para-aminobenzoate synthase component I